MADRTAPRTVGLPITLVVRTATEWWKTGPGQDAPTLLSPAALRAQLRATAPPGAGKGDDGRRWLAVHPDRPIAPIEVFVAEVGAGGLIVEGNGGVRLLLDETDLAVIDALRPGDTVGGTVARLRRSLGADAPGYAELSGRMRRLGAVGRVDLPIDESADPDWEAAAGVLDLEGAGDVDAGSTETESPFADGDAPASAAAPSRTSAAVARLRRLGATHRRRRSPGANTTVADDGGGGEGTQVPATVRAGDRTGAADDRQTPDGRVPVFAVFPEPTGPPLSLGMVLAAARAHDGGRLEECYDLRRLESPASFLDRLESQVGPAILLLSDYVWSVDHNLDLARRARALCPDLVVIHGGPSVPKDEERAARWLEANADAVQVAVRGEGEVTLGDALAALAPAPGSPLRLDRLREVPGLTYCDVDGGWVRTEDRGRIEDLDALPSPYLTGEFDHLEPSDWMEVVLESNRGCPYGCTFCDWGSSTLSRIRKFSMARVVAEMRWAAERGNGAWILADANFGIIARDVVITQAICEIRAETGMPEALGFNVAKNTTRHLKTIVAELTAAGVAPVFSLSLQTNDASTLSAVDRRNIDTDHYTQLAAIMRWHGLPLQGDLMLGLPGQTVDSFAADLQFLMDHEVPSRTWITQLLPNSPMGDPEYRARWEIETDEQGLVVSTASFTADDREQMLRLRHAYTVFEQFGLLRHVARFAQWDHGVPALDLLRRVIATTSERPHEYPLLTWVMCWFDHVSAAPLGWRSFYDEVRRFLLTEVGLPATTALDTVLQVQIALMPEVRRTFPSLVVLDHDYVTYFRERTASVWRGEPAGMLGSPLAEHPAGTLTVHGDPLGFCGTPGGLKVNPDPRNQAMTAEFWMVGHWELDSPLVVSRATVAASGQFQGLDEQRQAIAELVEQPGRDEPDGARLRVRRRRPAHSMRAS